MLHENSTKLQVADVTSRPATSPLSVAGRIRVTYQTCWNIVI